MKSSIASCTYGWIPRKRKAKGLSILRDMKPKHLRPKKKKSGDDPQIYFSAILLLQLMSKDTFKKKKLWAKVIFSIPKREANIEGLIEAHLSSRSKEKADSFIFGCCQQPLSTQ